MKKQLNFIKNWMLLLLKQEGNFLLTLYILFTFTSCNTQKTFSAKLDINKQVINIDGNLVINSLSFYGKKDSLEIDTLIYVSNKYVSLANIKGVKLKDYDIIQVQLHDSVLGAILSVYFTPDTLKSKAVYFKEIIE